MKNYAEIESCRRPEAAKVTPGDCVVPVIMYGVLLILICLMAGLIIR